jgi:hypothetical protein
MNKPASQPIYIRDLKPLLEHVDTVACHRGGPGTSHGSNRKT